MKNQKIIPFVIILAILLSTIVPYVSAVTITEGAPNVSITPSSWGGMTAVYPSSTGAVSAHAQSFNVTTAGYLAYATVNLVQHTGSPVGVFAAEIRDLTPDGTLLIGSTNTIDFESLPLESAADENQTFYFGSLLSLEVSHMYWLVIYIDSKTTLDASNFPAIAYRGASDSYSTGSQKIQADSTWNNQGYDMQFAVYVSDTWGLSPTASPSASSETDLETIIRQLTNFIVPLLVMLLPAFLLWWFGGRGKWPLLIGLAIGTGLAYMFIPGFPVWLVFLVSIGIIGMAYSDVSSGNGMT